MTTHTITSAPVFLGTDNRAYRIAAIRTGEFTFRSGDADVFLANVVKATCEDYASGTGIWVSLGSLREHADGTGMPNMWTGRATRAIVEFVTDFLARSIRAQSRIDATNAL